MSTYTIYVVPRAWTEIKSLPGSMRQRVKREIEGLAQNPRPANSKKLQTPDIEAELRRSRLDRWRIIYAVTEIDKIVDTHGYMGNLESGRRKPTLELAFKVASLFNVSVDQLANDDLELE